MRTPLTKELLLHLQEEGYTMLIAADQADNENYVFTPFKYEVDDFTNNNLTSDLEDDMILVIDQALQMNFEDYMNHDVIVP